MTPPRSELQSPSRLVALDSLCPLGPLEKSSVPKTHELKLRHALDLVARQQFALDQHAIVAVTDLSGTITYANDRFCELSGYAREELLGQNHRMLNSGVHSTEFFRAMYQTISQGKVWRGEICNRAKNGLLYWVASTIVPFVDHEGKLEQYVAIRSDITVLKRLTEELRFSQEQLRIFVEHSPAAVAMFDADMRYLVASRQWYRDYRLGDRDIVGCSHYDIFPEIPDRWKEHHRSCLAGAIIRADADLFLRANGSKQWLSYEVRPWHHADGTIGGIVIFTRDITQQKQAEEEHARFERKLMETQKLESLGLLAGGIAHDFNNILTGIVGNNSLALAKLPADSPVREHLLAVRDATQRASDLIRQMLAYSGRDRFVIQKMDMSRIVEETTRLIDVSISKKVSLRYDLARGLPPVEGDAAQLRQVIMNLVINASESIGACPGEIRVRTGLIHADTNYLTSIKLADQLVAGDYVSFEVADTGCGISAENLTRIFDPFFTTKFTGRGLGLAAVLGIVRSHKGALAVNSEEGKGTTFNMLIPSAPGDFDAPTATPFDDTAWRGSGTVLVVEDEETVRSTVERILIVLGFNVVSADDGQEGVAKYKQEPKKFCIVLLDLTMPRLDGAQVFAELRLINPDVRVVLMSGYSEQEATAHFSGKGLTAFIQKPFDVPALKRALKAGLA